MTDAKLRFVPVDSESEHVEILYQLLANRFLGISHVSMPSFSDHMVFVKENPYLHWYVIFLEDTPVGSTYVTDQNSIAVNLSPGFEHLLGSAVNFILRSHTPLPGIASVRPHKFVINVAPTNLKIRAELERREHKLIQLTYELTNSTIHNF